MSKRVFRLILAVYLLSVAADLAVEHFSKSIIPNSVVKAEANSVSAAYTPHGKSLVMIARICALAVISVAMVVGGLVGVVGMFVFWKPGIYVFFSAVTLRILLSPAILPWHAMTGWSSLFGDIGTIMEGVLFGLVFFGPAKQLFDKTGHDEEVSNEAVADKTHARKAMSPPFPQALSRKAAAGQVLAVAAILCGCFGLILWLGGSVSVFPKRLLLSAFLTGLLMLLFVVLFSLRDPDWRGSLGLGRFPLGPTLGWAVIGVITIYVTNFGVGLIYLVMHGDMGALLKAKDGWMQKFVMLPWSAILPLVVFVGFWEETVFRGFLLGRVRAALSARGGTATQWQRDMLAVVLTALLFGMGHAYQGVLGIVQTSAMGLVLGGLTLWRKSIWPAVFVHLTIDGVALVAIKLLAPLLHELTRQGIGENS